tara:strand:+ start:1907 stop:2314 length:408 start_codon:yes stop_codon:yes gene_type:complete
MCAKQHAVENSTVRDHGFQRRHLALPRPAVWYIVKAFVQLIALPPWIHTVVLADRAPILEEQGCATISSVHDAREARRLSERFPAEHACGGPRREVGVLEADVHADMNWKRHSKLRGEIHLQGCSHTLFMFGMLI